MAGEKYDAIVVGAGPGGAMSAYELAQAGVRTLLIEKARLPRYKTCGGGVSYKTARALPFSIEPVVERTITEIDFSWRTRNPYVVDSHKPLAYMVQRSMFDNFLVEKATGRGATLQDQTVVKSVEMDANGVLVDTSRGTFSADYLVGADGATGRVARALGLMSDRSAIAAIESELVADDATMQYWYDRLGIDLGELPAGYGWVFPKGDHLSVGVGGLPVVTDYGSRLKRYDEKHTAARVPVVKEVRRTHGYLLPLRQPGAPVQKGRAVLVGDAAGLVEAFTGEGIYWAVRSGQLAAAAIVKGGPQLDYQRQLDRRLMPNLISARKWLHVYYWLPRSCYLLPKHWSLFWLFVCRVMRGERFYTDIRRRLGPAGFVERLIPDSFRLAQS